MHVSAYEHMGVTDMDFAIKMFKALSDKTRLRIMAALIKAGKELCICELMDCLKMPHCNVSRHVKELKNAGFLKERREGKFMFYALSDSSDNFHKTLVKVLELMEDEEDNSRMKKRLALRKNGKCVVGIKCCC
jgi:ArsR family transcriptional regulator, arsenate/arsenite/antimonite-responsive transcriptional repressor